VCLKQPEREVRSGIDLPAGPQLVSGADALAFVRQRHDLEGGDLDRIARQQAFLAGMASRVLSAGTLSDPAAVRRLVEAVTRHVVLDRGWELDRLIAQFRRMSGGDIRFVTIPTGTPALETPVDGIAVQVDDDEVKAFVQDTIARTDAAATAPTDTPTPTPTPTSTSSPTVPTAPAATPESGTAAAPTTISAAGITCVD
jgi:anionic cell wall polymer biosynthesis LytR-Cps2A-Psr (LCP) family protein